MTEGGREPVALRLPRARRALWTATVIVCALGLGAELLQHLAARPEPGALTSLFSLSGEGNVPTWYASSLLLCCGLLLMFIALGAGAARAPHRYHFWVLALAFVYISLDETVTLHERLNDFVKIDIGVLHFGWIVPAAVLVLVMGILYLPFLVALPRGTRRRFVIAGALYVGGALVMELPLGWWTARAGSDNLVYCMIDFVEESLELSGATLFLVSLLDYARARFGGVALAGGGGLPRGDRGPAG